MNRRKRLNKTRARRRFRVGNRVRGTAARPRLTVFRSHRHIYVQLVDDEAGRTLCASSTRALGDTYGGTIDHAKRVGAAIAEKALSLNVQQVKFDRGAYRYHGRVRALADAAREKGLEF